VVAGANVVDLGPDRADDTRALMATDSGEMSRGRIARRQVVVGMTHAGRGHLDKRLGRPRVVEVDFLHLPAPVDGSRTSIASDDALLISPTVIGQPHQASRLLSRRPEEAPGTRSPRP
jgi:hypothetical protein